MSSTATLADVRRWIKEEPPSQTEGWEFHSWLVANRSFEARGWRDLLVALTESGVVHRVANRRNRHHGDELGFLHEVLVGYGGREGNLVELYLSALNEGRRQSLRNFTERKLNSAMRHQPEMAKRVSDDAADMENLASTDASAETTLRKARYYEGVPSEDEVLSVMDAIRGPGDLSDLVPAHAALLESGRKCIDIRRRAAGYLVFFYEYPQQDVAVLMGVSEGTVSRYIADIERALLAEVDQHLAAEPAPAVSAEDLSALLEDRSSADQAAISLLATAFSAAELALILE